MDHRFPRETFRVSFIKTIVSDCYFFERAFIFLAILIEYVVKCGDYYGSLIMKFSQNALRNYDTFPTANKH